MGGNYPNLINSIFIFYNPTEDILLASEKTRMFINIMLVQNTPKSPSAIRKNKIKNIYKKRKKKTHSSYYLDCIII